MPCESLAASGTWHHRSGYVASVASGIRVLRARQRICPAASKQALVAHHTQVQRGSEIRIDQLLQFSDEQQKKLCMHRRILTSSQPFLANATANRSFRRSLAALSGFLILQTFASQAWAVTDFTIQAQQGISFFGDIDEIKNGFTLAFLLIFFSELGDKTFFIAAILATRRSIFAVFTGTFGALVAMTLISVTLGRAFHYIDGVVPFRLGSTEIPIDDLAAAVLLIYFGVSTLLDAASMEGSKAGEEQQEAELAVAGVNAGSNSISNVVVSTFALVFVAEWGDKSFFSTIALAAASSPFGVVAGAIAGHGAATLLAVLGGSIMGNYISEKAIAYIGGILFLVFAADTLFEIFTGIK